MSVDERVYVVIPAYNEAQVIADVVAGVRRCWPNVIVVDDGSADATGAQARGAGAQVLRHAINLGQGAALQTGIKRALQLGASHLVTFDADGQHDVADIDALLEPLRRGSADIALGSRFKGEAIGLARNRRALLHAARWANYLLTGLRLSDAHNGLRAMTRRAASRLELRQPGMAHATELVAQVARLRLSYVEVPVTIRYTAYSIAKGQKLSNSVHIVLDLLLRGLIR